MAIFNDGDEQRHDDDDDSADDQAVSVSSKSSYKFTFEVIDTGPGAICHLQFEIDACPSSVQCV